MSANLTIQPDYDALVESLLEKTLAGKIQWDETAEENTFLAAVKGRQTFEISRQENKYSGDQVTLVVRDAEGKEKIRTENGSKSMSKLYSTAQRIDYWKRIALIAPRQPPEWES
ncbi:MAG: hypothetical protein IID46_12630 [Planctomycetes bacterium]|nr:hypothetical protein [Planctomycetota bacterium]